jgi:three-Cys-motif partner protein
MPIRNLHHKPFDEGTRDKLELYRDYLRNWLPVFINGPLLDSINVFDFFAGPGFDVEGNPGSPVITCDEIQKAIAKNDKRIVVIKAYFNEKASDKYANLSSYVEEQRAAMPQVIFSDLQKDFHSAFEKWTTDMRGRVANLLFLDQNGVKEITKSVFQSILELPRTDFLFSFLQLWLTALKNSRKFVKGSL